MEALKFQTVVEKGKITLDHLPIQDKTQVEVIVLAPINRFPKYQKWLDSFIQDVKKSELAQLSEDELWQRMRKTRDDVWEENYDNN